MENKISIHNPLGKERVFDPEKSVRFEIAGVVYKCRIDNKEKGLRITKIGKGSLRGEVDRITIVPETSHDFLLK